MVCGKIQIKNCEKYGTQVKNNNVAKML